MNSLLKPSPRFFFPRNGTLFSYSTLSPSETRVTVQEIDEQLARWSDETQCPSLMTRLALKKKEYRIGVYQRLGEKALIAELRRDLLYYQQEQERTDSPYLSLIAVFDDVHFESEAAFQRALQRHLSYLMEEKDLRPSADGKAFFFHFEGLPYSVTGMYPGSSNPSRQFYRPALIFNLCEQFEALAQAVPFHPRALSR